MFPFNVLLCFVMCFGALVCVEGDDVNIEDTTQTDLFEESFSDYRTNNPADLSGPTDSARSEDLSSSESTSSNVSPSSGKPSPSADSSTFTESISLQDPSKMEAVSTTSRRQRNLHGILGFLTGFRLAQGMGPTSYSADIRDSLDLNMFSRLFNAALFLSYIRNTNTLPLESVPTSYHPLLAYSQLSQNIFPTDLQLPVLYPPVVSLQDFNDPARQDKNNIQTIDSNTEVIAQNDTNEQNKQDINTTKISASENTTEEAFMAKSVPEVDKVKYRVENKTQTDNDNDKTTKQVVMGNNSATLKHNVTTVTSISSTEFNATNVNPMITSFSLKLADPTIATLKKENDEKHDKEGSTIDSVPTQQTVGAKPNNNTSTIAHIDNNSTEKPADANVTLTQTEMPDTVTSIDHSFYPYPYPYYHDYENSSDYEHITITESPVSQDHFLKQHEYYESPNTYDNNYFPHQDGEQTHPPFVKGDQFDYPDLQGEHFHPMSIPYYDAQSSYEAYTYQHDQIDNKNNNVQNNGFVPLGTLKHF